MPDIVYNPTTWADFPATSSAVNAANLNHGEQGIAAATAQANQALAAALDTSQSMSVGLPAATSSGPLVPNMLNPVDASSGVLVMTLPTGQPAGTFIAVVKMNGSALVPGNKVSVVGNIFGVPATTINLGTYKQVDMYLADATGGWWPVGGRFVLGTLDARFAPMNPSVHVVTNSGTTQTVPAPAVSGGYDHDYTLTAASCAFTLPSGLVDASNNPAAVELILWMRQNSAGGHDFTITNTIAWPGAVKPALNQAALALTPIVVSTLDGGATWLGSGGAYVPQSLAVSRGDLLYASGPGAFTRLASGTGNLQNDGAGNLSWGTGGAGAGVAAGTILAAVEYAQTSAQTQASTTSSTPVDLATIATTATWSGMTATYFDLTVTAPASGSVLLRASAYVKASGSGASVKLAGYDVGAAAVIPAGAQTMMNGTSEARVTYEKTVTGLTAGNSYTYRLQIGAGGGGTAFIDAGGTNGSVRFSAAAA